VEPIDLAFQEFRALRADVEEYIDSVTTEAATRLKVIDPVLLKVLLWPTRDVMD
jgi:hypothetical protein